MTDHDLHKKALAEYMANVKKFNDLHKWLKNFKKEVVLPSGRVVDKYAKKLYK